ncbi:MAG: nucleotide-binding protein [Deltaproteobacteria bacterium]|nr:nucleotide-binding protein [Deltaproteobacteria bacterium]
MTPDDDILSGGSQYSQARPNVIFEAGWFVGRLGIQHACLLMKEGMAVHSDIDGISRIHFRDNVEEKVLEIQQKLQAAGLVS